MPRRGRPKTGATPAARLRPVPQGGAASLERLKELYHAPKQVVQADWVQVERKASVELQLQASIEIERQIVEGLQLRGTALRRLPDANVMFQLELVLATGARQHIGRLEWRPLRPHRNGALGPDQYKFQDIWTHYHPWAENAALGPEAFTPQQNLPIGVPLEPEPKTFQDVLVKLKELFNILNPEAIPEPPWEAELF